ncbi:uncharacterized protein si:ch211-281l24.3 isoform X5 [Pygocentrus nattereri]|uniref:uncharacterized protein si:ch211-281l24.3 isoform X5 n=1 Tax=Pygocentrus nattereri TaxID=42514 RepID=UPI0018910286|nr:uncharacterized protein si:ch211-281l24.3 isoform X5 [Pygocentrus nattereri]
MSFHVCLQSNNGKNFSYRMKLASASPAPTCASDASGHSMDRPIMFKHGTELETASPAPTCTSAESDHSMDRPIMFKQRRKLETASPAPTCASAASDHSMDHPIMFKHRLKAETASPAPTCASAESDHSMDHPIMFNHRRKLETASPAPTCASAASDHSMDHPIMFKHRLKAETASPAPTCASAESDHSMDHPIMFNHRMKLRSASSVPTCASDASDRSMDRPIMFKHGMKPEIASPAPTCASFKSDHSMDRPIMFKQGIEPENIPSPLLSLNQHTRLRDEACSPDISELSASLLTEDHFRCPVCTDVLKDPVSIPCGHSYCKTCIQTYWTKPTLENSYCCPQCRKSFRTRPALDPNSALAKVVQKLQQAGFSPALPAHCYAGPGDVACDFCTGRKLRAVKSCLTCPASYCQTHVKQHYTVAALQRHMLVEVTGELEQRLCKLHQRALEVFCKTDQTFICLLCTMEEHKEHHTVLAKSEESPVQISENPVVINVSQTQVYKMGECKDEPLSIPFNSLRENEMEQQMKQLLKDNIELTVRAKKAESELDYLTECRRLEQADDFVEVSALGRILELGMLYDCRSDSFNSDAFLWDVNTLSSMRLSLHRPHTDVRIVEGKSLQERLKALDLTASLRASVVSGLVEVAGAAAYLKHPTQSQLQDRVTLHYRTSTRLDMLSHRLLRGGDPLSMTSQNSATHVVVAVLYGAQAFLVFDDKNESSEGSLKLKDKVKKNFLSQSAGELLLSLEKANCFFELALYTDGEDFNRLEDFDTAVKRFRSLQKLLEPQDERAVPLKVWLYPLKKLVQTSPHVVGSIKVDILDNAVDVLEHLERNINICLDMMSIYSNLGVNSWYPHLKDALSEFSSLMRKYQSDFQKRLASCIKTIREKGEKGEQILQDLLKKNMQSPFSPQNMHNWLLNKDVQVVALNECRAANVTIVKSQDDLKRLIEDSQADRVLCFTLTSLEGEDPFLSALKQNMMNREETQAFRLPDISQKIHSHLHLFLSNKKTNEDAEHTKFIATSEPQPHFPEPSVCLYQFGNIVKLKVNLELKPDLPEKIITKQTSVAMRLQTFSVVHWYRMEYRTVSCRGGSRFYLKWSDIDVYNTGESVVIRGLTPETQYQLRYAVMDTNSMSDYSRITEFQTLPRARPGRPKVHKQNKDSLTVSWLRAEADEDSPVLHYMVEYMEAGLQGWQLILTEGPECECTVTLPYSTCYRVRVSAVYRGGDNSKPSEQSEVSLDVWYIDLSERKTSLFLEVLKLQTEKKPVELRGWSDEESEVRSFLQCLPYISQLRFHWSVSREEQNKTSAFQFLLNLSAAAAESDSATGQRFTELLTSVCSYSTFPFDQYDPESLCDFLLDLHSYVKNYEAQTGRTVLPALQPVYQSAPAEWIINLSERKSSLFLEVLKLQTEKKPVELRGWPDEESEVRSFLQCLPYISQLRFYWSVSREEQNKTSAFQFLLNLSAAAAAESDSATGQRFTELLTSVCSYSTFPFDQYDPESLCDFLLDLCSYVKNYETQTGRTVLPGLQPVYQSAPAVWIIDLSERKSSLFLEVLKLQTEKKPVELRGWPDEESEVRSFLQCLPYISQLRFYWSVSREEQNKTSAFQFLLNLSAAAAESDSATGQRFTELLTSVCSYSTFPFDQYDPESLCDFLLDLHSYVKNYEAQTGRTVLPALQPVYQSAPAEWIINLSERKSSLFLEVLKLQTEKKPVELRGWPDEESEVRSFLQCLPYISQLRFYWSVSREEQNKTSAFQFLLNLSAAAAAESDSATGQRFTELLTSVCSYSTFPFDQYDPESLCDFLLDLCSYVKNYETQTGRTVLPGLQPVYQSAPAVWIIDLSERKSSLFLEVLKLQTEKKPVELRGWPDEESEVRSFLQCLPYISQLRLSQSVSHEEQKKKSAFQFLLNLSVAAAAESDSATGQRFTELLRSVCSYSTFPFDKDYMDYYPEYQWIFLLDLYSYVKNYEAQTGRTVLPALQPVYLSAPAVWIIDLSERKSSLFLEVLKLQTEKKPVELWGWSDEESEVRSFLQCLPYISQLRFCEESEDNMSSLEFLLSLSAKVSECDTDTTQSFTELLTSMCSERVFPFDDDDDDDEEDFSGPLCDFLLDLFSHVKNYETQTGRTVLPALQPVYQSAAAVWIIDLSGRKSSLFLEVLKLQTEKKPVKLTGWPDEESEVRSFLQCLPYISQLRFCEESEDNMSVLKFLLSLSAKVSECDTDTTQSFTELLTSMCSERVFPFDENDDDDEDDVSGALCDFLLDLFSHVKNYETQTGRTVLPALQPVYQSAAAVWIIDLSGRKSSLFLEVLKLQTEKKPVKLTGWPDEESEVRSFLQCLPYISQLRFQCFVPSENKQQSAFQFLLNLSAAAAAEGDSATGEGCTELLASVCSYSTFPYGEHDEYNTNAQCEFLLDLFSHVKNYETQTGRTVLPALQPVYQSAPIIWIINLSERKSSLFLEVLKLQTVKKPVELAGWSDEESEVRSFLQCLPYISQLRLYFGSDTKKNIQIFLDLFSKAAESERQTGEKTLELLTSVCTYSSFPYGSTHSSKQSEFLLDLFSHVKNYETQTGRNVLPALQPVYQSAPAVWTINLSERKSSLFLEVLKLQTVNKPVELTGWSDEESEVRSFLQCLPYVSQLRLYFGSDTKKNIQIFLDLFSKASESGRQTGEKTLELLTSVCTYSSFPYRDTHRSEQCEFLLDLFSHVKNCETQTGRNVLPALQPVYQSAPTVWTVDLSERKSSLFLEVLKLQIEKKPVKLRGWSDEESEVRSLLQCLPYISQLRFFRWSNINKMIQSFMDMLMKAAEREIQTGEKTLQLLSSLCTYSSFPFGDVDRSDQSEFLLDLFSHVKNCETQTGRTVLPALQPVYQSAPAVWIIDLSKRKSSLFLEVLKLQTVKKPLELTGWSDEESEVRSFLQCLPYISQLRGAEQCVPSVCKVLHSRGEAEQVAPLLRALDFTLSLEGKLVTSSCRALGRVLGLSSSRLNLTLNPRAISLRGSRCLFRHITHLHTLRLSGVMVVKLERALRARRAPVTVTVEELSLNQSNEWSKKKLSRVLSSLASLLRHWNVQCLNMTEHTMEVQSLTVLLCHQGSLTIRLSKKSLQKLVAMVNDAQDEELTRGFLQKVGGDLTSCSLNWEMIHYFLQYHTVTVDFRKSNIEQQHIRELVSVLDRVQLRRLTSSFVLPIIREIYETGSAHCVSSLLSSVKNCINLNSRELDSVHCAALRFTLQHCTSVSLSLLWTSIPEGELESIVPLLSHVSHLSVDRLLLLRLLHCCSASELQQGAAAVLLAALQHRLDFSCSSALDLTEHTQTHTLSSEDCRVVSMTIQRSRTPTQLILQDCEMEEAGVERLFTILHKVTLHCSKALLLQFLSLVHVGTELDCVRRAVALSQALGEEVDLSQTKLDLQACRSLARFLEHSEGLTELDLSHCQLTDHCLKLLLPHLHKIQILDLSHNHITDISAKGIYDIVSTNSNIQTVRLFSNRITERLRFLSDQRFEIW